MTATMLLTLYLTHSVVAGLAFAVGALMAASGRNRE